MSVQRVVVSFVSAIGDLMHVIKLLLIQPVVALSRMIIRQNSPKRFFEGKTVLITGASSGIGRALAKHLAGLGSNLILSSRSKDKLEEVSSEIKKVKPSCKVATVDFDISQYTKVSEFIVSVKEKLLSLQLPAQIDILVNNAGVSSRGTALATTLDTTEAIMALNFFAPVALTREVLPDMMTRRSGAIVVISSVQGKVSIPYRSSYSASKHALQAYFDSLRAEIASSSISVTTVSPGYVRTNLSLNALNGDGSKYGVMDETTAKGMLPSTLAEEICTAVAAESEDVLIADASSSLAVVLKNSFPELLSMIMRKRAQKDSNKYA